MKVTALKFIVGIASIALAFAALYFFVFSRNEIISPEPKQFVKSVATASALPSTGAMASPSSVGPIGFDFRQEVRSFSTAGADELLNYYRRGVRPSASLEEKYLADRAIDYCKRTILDLGYPMGLDSSDVYPEIVKLQNAWRERCRHFRVTHRSALLSDMKRIRGELASPGSKFNLNDIGLVRSPTENQMASVRQELARRISENGPEALSWLAQPLADWLEAASKSETLKSELPESLRSYPDLISYSMNIVYCRVASSCGQDSLDYFASCALSGICGKSMEHQLLENARNEDKAAVVLAQVQAIQDALLLGRLRTLGLASN